MADTVDTSQHVFCTNCNLDLTTTRNGPYNVIPENYQRKERNNTNYCYQCFVMRYGFN